VWYLYALLSAIFASVRKANEKQLSHKLNHFTIGWTLQLLSLPVITAALLARGKFFNPLTLGPKFWLPTIAILLGFYPLNTFLYVNAVKHGELSKILPLQSFGPVIGLSLAWLLVNQKPSLAACIGILVVVLGVYVLNLKGKYLHNPLKIFTADHANLLTLGSLFLSSFAGILDVIVVKVSDPIYYAFIDTLGAVIVLYITSLIFRIRENGKIKQNLKSLIIAGFCYGGTYVAYLIAISIAHLAYVSTLRTSGIIIFSAAIGWYLKESITKLKILALVLIALGSVILGLN
jgi:transporter family protein